MHDQGDADDSKLTRTKLRFAEEQRFLTGHKSSPDEERLPPGQSWVKGFPVLDLGIKPEISPVEWELKIFGAVAEPVTVTWADLMHSLPQTEVVVDIHCVTTWSHLDCSWEGVLTRDILSLVVPDPAARFVLMHSADGYSTNLAIEDFLAEDCLIAHTMKGMPLELDHGAPARLVVPHLYFWKSAKWVTGIEILVEDEPGYWEQRNYHNRGNPWAEERYGSPIKAPWILPTSPATEDLMLDLFSMPAPEAIEERPGIITRMLSFLGLAKDR